MYRDTNHLDIELLTEVGRIAHRIRQLYSKLPLKVDSNCLGARLFSIESSNQSSSPFDVSDSGGAVESSECSAECHIIAHVEHYIVDLYERHVDGDQNQMKENFTANEQPLKPAIRSRIYHLTGGDDYTMNESSANVPRNDSDKQCDSKRGKCKRNDERNEAIGDDIVGKTIVSSSFSSSCRECPSVAIQPNHSNAIVQQMPEIQISNTDTDDRTVSNKIESDFRRNRTRESGMCCGLQSSFRSNQLNKDDLRKLIDELNHKVEAAERMNWLCESGCRLQSESSLFPDSFRSNETSIGTT